MPKPQNDQAMQTARATFEAARDLARREPTKANQDAARAAWAELSKVSPPVRAWGFGSRAGQKQQQELRKERQDALRRLGVQAQKKAEHQK